MTSRFLIPAIEKALYHYHLHYEHFDGSYFNSLLPLLFLSVKAFLNTFSAKLTQFEAG